MPYIKERWREDLTPRSTSPAVTPGELNFQFTVLARRYLEGKGLSYEAINDVLGALDGAAREFYRRVAAPYEDRKIEENGDVY